MTRIESPRRAHRRLTTLTGLAVCATLSLVPATAAQADGGGVGTGGGGGGGQETTSGSKAKLVNGKAVAPESAPAKVKKAIAAANKIRNKPYKYGGGHGKWNDSGYDCSGAVSYALGKPGAKIVDSPMPSGSFERWGENGKGDWITVYANGNHMYAVIAGLRWDTSQTAGNGPGWSKNLRAGKANGPFKTRHYGGL